MKRWKKTTRVNGQVIETLRLRHFQSADRGVMISLQLTHEKQGYRLSLEVDGDCVITKRDEALIIDEVQRLLADIVAQLEPEVPLNPLPPPSIKRATNESSTPTSDVRQGVPVKSC